MGSINLKKENNNLLSEALFKKLMINLADKKQSLIFLNRRGYSPSLLCKDCGFFFRCPNCDVGMTWHKRDGSVKCKYCEFEDRAPDTCPDCGGINIKDIGHGTEKLEEQLKDKEAVIDETTQRIEDLLSAVRTELADGCSCTEEMSACSGEDSE